MAKFNPMMLDASIRDVVSALSSEQKTDVLLYAMERIVSNPKARTTVENAASSAIQMSVARPDKAIQARLLRARARLAADLRGAAHKDLQEILEIDPHHPEASSLMPSNKALDRAPGQLQFMNEIWREIATYLSKRDLRAVLQVPHPLSSIASGLLFRTVNLHFGSLGDAKELDDWYARRSAEILNHLVLHPAHASCVHSLNIFASGGTDAYAFQLAMVENVLPKLVNLTALGCHFPGPAIQTLLRTVEKTGAKLKSLVLDPTSPLPGELPNFPLLTHFAYGGEKVDCPTPAGFAHVLAGRSIVLRSLVLHNARFPLDGRVPLSNLMSLDLRLVVRDTTLLNTIFAEGRHLERLSLSIKLSRHEHVPLSETFRAHARALPALRGFALHIDGAPREPADLVPSITDFVMHHEKLRSLRVTHALGEHDEPSSSVIWSALPRLTELEVLSLDLPSEHVLASWLIPKSVECLHLRFVRPPSEGASLLAQLLPGLPRGLRMLSLPTINVSATLRDMLHTTLPELALLSLGGVTHSVSHAPQGIELERWSERRGRFYLSDLDGREGTSWVAGLPWHWR